MSKLTQQDFDELKAITIHLLTDDKKHALCSGLEVDPSRWLDDKVTLRKQCQACLRTSINLMKRRLLECELK